MPYGKTVFLGESISERETAVARLLDTCILIEGGPGKFHAMQRYWQSNCISNNPFKTGAAHEVEEFIWNDHFVIPVISTGGAASGLYGVPVKIFDQPCNVTDKDWALLADHEAPPIEVAKAVVRIVMVLKEALANHALNRLQDTSGKKQRKLTRKVTKAKKVDLSAAANAANSMPEGLMAPESPEKILPVIDSIAPSINSINGQARGKAKSKWKSMRQVITFSKRV